MMKFEQRLAAARTLGWLLSAYLVERRPQRPDVIVPVPLHTSRLRQRGFNQALELARPVARALGVPLAISAVQRVKRTRAQSELTTLRDRQRNLRRAFACQQKSVDRLRVAVVDDVMTTGTTIAELTQALLDNGANRVTVWSLARTGGTTAG